MSKDEHGQTSYGQCLDMIRVIADQLTSLTELLQHMDLFDLLLQDRTCGCCGRAIGNDEKLLIDMQDVRKRCVRCHESEQKLIKEFNREDAYEEDDVPPELT